MFCDPGGVPIFDNVRPRSSLIRGDVHKPERRIRSRVPLRTAEEQVLRILRVTLDFVPRVPSCCDFRLRNQMNVSGSQERKVGREDHQDERAEFYPKIGMNCFHWDVIPAQFLEEQLERKLD